MMKKRRFSSTIFQAFTIDKKNLRSQKNKAFSWLKARLPLNINVRQYIDKLKELFPEADPIQILLALYKEDRDPMEILRKEGAMEILQEETLPKGEVVVLDKEKNFLSQTEFLHHLLLELFVKNYTKPEGDKPLDNDDDINRLTSFFLQQSELVEQQDLKEKILGLETQISIEELLELNKEVIVEKDLFKEKVLTEYINYYIDLGDKIKASLLNILSFVYLQNISRAAWSKALKQGRELISSARQAVLNFLAKFIQLYSSRLGKNVTFHDNFVVYETPFQKRLKGILETVSKQEEEEKQQKEIEKEREPMKPYKEPYRESILQSFMQQVLEAQSQNQKMLLETQKQIMEAQQQNQQVILDSLKQNQQMITMMMNVVQAIIQPLSQVTQAYSQPLRELQDEIKNLRTSLQAKDEEIKVLLQAKEKEIKTLLQAKDEEIKTLQQEIKKLQDYLQKKDRRMDYLQATLQDRKLRIDALQGHLRATQQKIDILQGDLQAKEKEIKDLRETLRASQEALQNLKASLQAKEGEIKHLQETLKTNKQEIDTLRGLLEAKEKEIEKLQATLRRNQETLQNRDKEIEQLKQTLQSKGKEIEHLKQTLQAKDKELQALKQQHRLDLSFIEDLIKKGNIPLQDPEKERIRKGINKLLLTIKTLEEENALLRKENDELISAIQNIFSEKSPMNKKGPTNDIEGPSM